ncbi:MAG: hypothetical protein N4A49_04055, partial [Marinifilaceae bacterium]|nr:hypothetical protein [Marinifilaceae bacterium]
MKSRIFTLIIMMLCIIKFSVSQVVITEEDTDNSINKNSILEIRSESRGVLFPKLTFENMNALVEIYTEAEDGMIVYCFDAKYPGLYIYEHEKTAWKLISEDGSPEVQIALDKDPYLISDSDKLAPSVKAIKQYIETVSYIAGNFVKINTDNNSINIIVTDVLDINNKTAIPSSKAIVEYIQNSLKSKVDSNLIIENINSASNEDDKNIANIGAIKDYVSSNTIGNIKAGNYIEIKSDDKSINLRSTNTIDKNNSTEIPTNKAITDYVDPLIAKKIDKSILNSNIQTDNNSKDGEIADIAAIKNYIKPTMEKTNNNKQEIDVINTNISLLGSDKLNASILKSEIKIDDGTDDANIASIGAIKKYINPIKSDIKGLNTKIINTNSATQDNKAKIVIANTNINTLNNNKIEKSEISSEIKLSDDTEDSKIADIKAIKDLTNPISAKTVTNENNIGNNTGKINTNTENISKLNIALGSTQTTANENRSDVIQIKNDIIGINKNNVRFSDIENNIAIDNTDKDSKPASIAAIKDLVKTTDDKAEKNITDITAANTLISDNTSLANKNKSDIANNLSLANTNKTNIETANTNIANNESTANKNKTDIEGINSSISNLVNNKLDASKVKTEITNDGSKDSEVASIGAIKNFVKITDNKAEKNISDIADANTKIDNNKNLANTNKTNIETANTNIANNTALANKNKSDIERINSSISNLGNNKLDANKVNTTIPTDNNTKDAEVASIGAIKNFVKTTENETVQNKTNIAENLNFINTNKNNIATANTKIDENTSLANKNKSDIATNLSLTNTNKTDIEGINSSISNLVNNKLDANKVNTTIPTDNNTKDAEVASIGAIKNLVKTTDDKAEQNKSNITANLNQTNTNKSDIATANTKIGENTSLANKNKSDIATNLSLANTNKTNIETANSNIASNNALANKNKTDIESANTNIANNTTLANKNKTDIETANTNIANNNALANTNKTDIETANTNITNNTTLANKNKTNIESANTNIASNNALANTNKTDIASIKTNIADLGNDKLDANKVNTEIITEDTKDNEIASIGAIKNFVKTTENKTVQNKTDITENLNLINTNKNNIATANTLIGDNTSLANKNKSDIATNLSLTNTNKTDIASIKTNIADLGNDKLEANKVNTEIITEDTKDNEIASIGAIKNFVKTTENKTVQNKTDITENLNLINTNKNNIATANTLIGDNTSLANKNKSDIATNLSLAYTNKTNIETANSNIANNESTANKNKTDIEGINSNISNLVNNKLDANKVNTTIPTDNNTKDAEVASIGAIKDLVKTTDDK